MHKEQKHKVKNSCFNCLWEPVWYQSGAGFEGTCRRPGGKDVTIRFQDDVLQYANEAGEHVSEACPRWSSTVS